MLLVRLYRETDPRYGLDQTIPMLERELADYERVLGQDQHAELRLGREIVVGHGADAPRWAGGGDRPPQVAPRQA
jgi:hypothetical protein